MTQKAKNIVSSIPELTLAELWVVVEAAQAQIRQYTVHPEASDDKALLTTIQRRYEEILTGKAKLIPGEIFDIELEKK